LSSTQISVNFHGWNHVSPIDGVENLCQSFFIIIIKQHIGT